MKPAERRMEQEERRGRAKPAYQLEIGTKSLLAGLLALAVVCGMFFAFGYTIGKHAIPATFTLGSAPPVKPGAASAAAPAGVEAPNPAQLGAAESNQTPDTLTPPAPQQAPPDAPAAANSAAASSAAAGAAPPPAAAAPPAANPAGAPPAEAAHSAAPAPAPTGGLFLVQVFAGLENDARSLAVALQGRGYPAHVVAPAAGAANQLYRVQVGPYLTRAEADAMRSRLTADGYQAVIKNGGTL
jgi:DedD protein